MKFVSEYRDPTRVKALASEISERITRPWSIMEVCGGQTHAILKHGLEQLLPPDLTLLHGPGCPVCVTPSDIVDQAIFLASQPDVVLCTFGDMIRVPGGTTNLAAAKARGGDVRVVYSPMDALHLAEQMPEKTIVFFAIGFETTAPTTAMAVFQAKQKGLNNFTLLVSHVRVPPALEALLSAPDHTIDAFLAAGHVCTVMGLQEYQPIAQNYHVPIVATGFEPVDILEGVLMCFRQLETGIARVENQYDRAVRPEGSAQAVKLVRDVYEEADQEWRGIGQIQKSGFRLRPEYAHYDAAQRFELANASPVRAKTSSPCISGDVLCGRQKPSDCSAFARECTPLSPLGAPMVSAEGACAAYYRYAMRTV
ncbi:MAG: hydrogenase formation protein HypD [Henriciella sp.]|nr:hydrogenase formation protein HypD [Henriciella sp.]